MAITTSTYQELINNTLGDKNRAARFIANITSAVAVNPALQDCDASTILAGALLGESLELSPSPQLGQFYLVPFECAVKDENGKTVYQKDNQGNIIKDKNGKWKAVTVKKANFVMGYKGYIQLAIRSGYYKKLNILEIKDGELIKFDPLTETIECKIIDDFEEREKAKTIGYYAMFEYVNGFRKAIYWGKEKMLSHADKYSPAFSKESYYDIINGKVSEKDLWRYSSFWYKDFDGMAKKTMLRQLIGKWGAMSVQSNSLTTAMESDNHTYALDSNSGTGFIEADTIPDVEPTEAEAPQNPAPAQNVKQVSLDDF